MSDSPARGLILASFNAEVLAGYLNNDPALPAVVATCGPYGQVFQALMDGSQMCWQAAHDFTVVWTQPEAVVEPFRRLLAHEPVPLDQLDAAVDDYCAALAEASRRVRFMLVPSWVIPSYQRGLGLLDMRHEMGVSHALLRMNLRLVETLARTPNVYVLNASRWIELVGPNAFNPKLMYMSKVAFGNGVFKEAVRDIKAAVAGVGGGARKLIVLDLDDTLWGGIVGDVGWENLTLGGHDAIGEAFADFQHALKALARRGILLAIVSKNEEAVAMQAIGSHPEMALRRDDFVGWRINWGDKAANIAALAADLNLGLQSVVFIDDNPVERGRVSEALPEVLVPDWPQDKMLYAKTLLSLTCFDTPTLTQEDRARREMYQADQGRNAARVGAAALEDWLQGLGIRVAVEPLRDENLARTAQLLNKTNQMNLTTRRLTESELKAWAADPDHPLWALRVSDRFGDLGLVGIVSLSVEGRQARLVDFVLSCRAMGRGVERVMLAVAARHAQLLGLDTLRIEHAPTAKNAPCLKVLEDADLTRIEPHVFEWPAAENYPPPGYIEVVESHTPLGEPVA